MFVELVICLTMLVISIAFILSILFILACLIIFAIMVIFIYNQNSINNENKHNCNCKNEVNNNENDNDENCDNGNEENNNNDEDDGEKITDELLFENMKESTQHVKKSLTLGFDDSVFIRLNKRQSVMIPEICKELGLKCEKTETEGRFKISLEENLSYFT